MSVPVNRLKLFAFAFGAGIAGFTGTIFAAVETGVFPQNFDLALLITVYAMLILGGAGSLVGAALGAIIINAILEVLSTPEQATFVFFVGIGLALLVYVRPWWRLGLIAGGTVVFGIVAYQLADALQPAWTSGTIEGGRFSDLLSGWVIHPAYPEQLGKYAFVALIACVIVLSQWRSFWGRAPVADSDALSRGDGLGGHPRREPERHPADPARRVARGPDDPPARGHPRAEARGDRVMALLELAAVSKSFGGLRVIHDLDLHVFEREIVSVIGPNGAGKTTLFNLITGIFPPDSSRGARPVSTNSRSQR